jgi:hypothetical protein
VALSAPSRGAALAPLSSRQRQVLAGLAALAFAELRLPKDEFDDWRHDQVRKAVGRAGLRECRNEDFLPLKAHFNELLGNMDAAFKAAFRHANEPRSWALFSLHKEATKAKDVLPGAMQYARGFLLNKRGVSLEDADEKAIWHAVFTVRNKAALERKKKSKGGESVADVLARILPTRRIDPDKEPF